MPLYHIAMFIPLVRDKYGNKIPMNCVMISTGNLYVSTHRAFF